jgi:hypothetical protein
MEDTVPEKIKPIKKVLNRWSESEKLRRSPGTLGERKNIVKTKKSYKKKSFARFSGVADFEAWPDGYNNINSVQKYL